MHKYLKRILLGFVIWLIPFVVSCLVWDIEAGVPTVSMGWFNALMAGFWALGFAIAAYFYFRDVAKKAAVKEGVWTGITWWFELCILDLIVLVGIFGMVMADFYPMLLTYLNAVLICIAIGYLKK